VNPGRIVLSAFCIGVKYKSMEVPDDFSSRN
jgi:hypothetical protein